MTKILVTGGTGFVGGFLIPRLLKKKYEVFVISRQAGSKTSNKYLHFLQADLSDRNSLESIKAKIRDCEVLIDLAALIPGSGFGKENLTKNLLANIEANIIGHVNLLEVLGKKIKKIIYASSIDVYGLPSNTGYSENHPTRPETFYGACKLFVEHAYRIFCIKKRIDFLTLRFSQIYGINEHPINVIPLFLQKIRKNQPLILFGNGEDVRSFLYVDDAVEAICLALSTKNNGIFNVAGKESVTINGVVGILKELVHKKVKIVQKPRKKIISRQIVNIGKIRKDLGFKPKFTLKRGLGVVIGGE